MDNTGCSQVKGRDREVGGACGGQRDEWRLRSQQGERGRVRGRVGGGGQQWLQLHKLGHVNIDLHQGPVHKHASWMLAGC